MNEDLHLASDLALILISAGVITLVFRWLKQPLILGYIVAGFLVGPHFDLFPNVASTVMVDQWAELGIIFLLFALGLEFSFKKLLNVGSSALITSITIFLGMFLVGLGVGRAMGWSSMESIFLGGMLSMSSTTIIIKAFDDLGLKKQPFTTIVFGTLVVEDLLAILLMVLLSTAAVSKQFAGGEMLQSMLKLGFFLILWFLVGIYLIPSFLKWTRKIMNDETVLILGLGLCFGMVVLAGYAGFSSALGAFVMGSILAETLEGEHLARTMKGVKDLFGAIFFVSVGMMVDPAIIVQYWKPILILTVVVMTCIPVFATTGVLIAGRPLKLAVRAGFSMAQIGEFAFIIAALGSSLKVMQPFIYPVIVSVSVITTFTTPYFIRLSEPFSLWLYKKLPVRWMQKLDTYASGSLSVNRKSDWKKLLTTYVLRVLLYSVLLIAILVGAAHFLEPYMLSHWAPRVGELAAKWMCAIITVLAMSPFLIAIGMYRGKSNHFLFQKLWADSRSNRGPLVALILFRSFLALAFLGSVFFHFFPLSHWTVLAILVAIAAFIFISRKNIRYFEHIEDHFFSNLNQKEDLEREKAPMRTSISEQLAGHDIRVENVVVSPNSVYIGHKLQTIPFRREYGINILKIIRGKKIITLPRNDDRVYPYDTLVVVGRQEQIAHFMAVMEADANALAQVAAEKIAVSSALVGAKSPILGKAIAECGARAAGCLVLGVERGPRSYMNPTADFVFEEGDKVWFVGELGAWSV